MGAGCEGAGECAGVGGERKRPQSTCGCCGGERGEATLDGAVLGARECDVESSSLRLLMADDSMDSALEAQ
jgi:hypothetical protein